MEIRLPHRLGDAVPAGGRCTRWTGLLLVAGALLLLQPAGCQRGEEGSSDREIPQPGQFLSDSLGVGLLLPNSPGWSFRRDPPAPGGAYIAAVYQSQRASVRLFVHPRPPTEGLDEVIRRRRDQLAGFFHVNDLDDVIEKVMQEDTRPLGEFPAWQWQAVSEPVAVAGEEPSRVMFMLAAVERPQQVFEVLGLLRFPVRQSPAQEDSTRALLNDLGFVMQSFQVR